MTLVEDIVTCERLKQLVNNEITLASVGPDKFTTLARGTLLQVIEKPGGLVCLKYSVEYRTVGPLDLANALTWGEVVEVDGYLGVDPRDCIETNGEIGLYRIAPTGDHRQPIGRLLANRAA